MESAVPRGLPVPCYADEIWGGGEVSRLTGEPGDLPCPMLITPNSVSEPPDEVHFEDSSRRSPPGGCPLPSGVLLVISVLDNTSKFTLQPYVHLSKLQPLLSLLVGCSSPVGGLGVPGHVFQFCSPIDARTREDFDFPSTAHFHRTPS